MLETANRFRSNTPPLECGVNVLAFGIKDRNRLLIDGEEVSS